MPDPLEGAACKRWRMFLRWMVRPGWPDLGLWNRYPARQLVIPLDTHVARVSQRMQDSQCPGIVAVGTHVRVENHGWRLLGRWRCGQRSLHTLPCFQIADGTTIATRDQSDPPRRRFRQAVALYEQIVEVELEHDAPGEHSQPRRGGERALTVDPQEPFPIRSGRLELHASFSIDPDRVIPPGT